MRLVVTFAIGLCLCGRSVAGPPSDELFESKIRPIFVEHCQKCHGANKQSGGLRLDSGAAMTAGGDSGSAVIPGDPQKSRLVAAVKQTGDLKMPPKEKLSGDEIEALSAWVKAGAPWPEKTVTAAPEAASRHWAFQPVHAPPVPAIRGTSNPIDAFVQAKLEAKGIALSPPADRATWLRRVTFDLTGLPPTVDELDAFLNDPAADAYAKVVDRLLASPRYGERWGRHWLDIARYADSKGYLFTEDRNYPFAYTYRDYVIRAFNDDLPYDRFIVEQLAADRVPNAEPQTLAALGFLTLGRRFLNNPHDIIDDRIDVVTRGLLGLTVTCARCHDHKFDPIPTSDYYSLYGVFASCTEPKEGPLLVPAEQTAAYTKFQKRLSAAENEIAKYRNDQRERIATIVRVTSQISGVNFAGLGPSPWQSLPDKRFDRIINGEVRRGLRAVQKKVEDLRASAPPSPPRGMVLNDRAKPVEPHVLIRGNPGRIGPAVPRQFLAVLAPNRKPFQDGSGRLELARAIADPKNPLTARVFVNRVWAHHFGKGLVTTPSDFGMRSDPPLHPELLDWLADRFVADGWSIKKLQRSIVLSKTYCQASGAPTTADPEDRLLGHFPRQRLDFEALRDSLLFVAGRLDPALGGPAVDILKEPFIPRRTIYGYIDRQNLPGVYRTFDFAGPDTHAPQRYTTTTPQQALFLMNNPFAVQQAQAVAARPEIAHAVPEERIAALYRLLFARPPSTDELELGLRFVSAPENDSKSKLNAWERYAQVLLLSNEFGFID